MNATSASDDELRLHRSGRRTTRASTTKHAADRQQNQRCADQQPHSVDDRHERFPHIAGRHVVGHEKPAGDEPCPCREPAVEEEHDDGENGIDGKVGCCPERIAQGEAAPPQRNAAEDQNSGRDEPCFVPGQAREDKTPSRLRARSRCTHALSAGKPRGACGRRLAPRGHLDPVVDEADRQQRPARTAAARSSASIAGRARRDRARTARPQIAAAAREPVTRSTSRAMA